MFENEEIRRMNVQKTSKIRDNLCFSIHEEDFSQTAVNGVWDITDTETNMIDALNMKKKIGNVEKIDADFDLFFSGRVVESIRKTKTLIAVCNTNADFKALLEEIIAPWCVSDFFKYKEIVVLTNFWSSKVFEKYKNGILDFSVNDDIKIGFFLVTDYGTSKILRIS